MVVAIFTEAEARMAEIETRVAALMGVINAATAGLVSAVAEIADTSWWNTGGGIRSAEHWVTLRCGVSPARARRLVATARGLGDLPRTRASFEAGELTEDHVGEIARSRPTEDQEEAVVALARVMTVPQLRKALSFLPPAPPAAADDPDDPGGGGVPAPPEPEPERPPHRVGFGHDDDGTWRLHARLRPEDGAVVARALEACREAEFRNRFPDGDPAARQEVTWVDALVVMARAAQDGLGAPGRGGERCEVLVHLEADHPGTPARLHLGPLLSPAARRHLSCDASVRAWVTDHTGSVDLGRRRRTVDPRLRTVVERRDQGCVVPGCGATRWLRVHHLRHWEHGGPTDTTNLAALCQSHHAAVHRGGITITGDPDHAETLAFVDARGRPIGPSPPRAPDAPPTEAARQLGLAEPRFEGRSGEAPDWDCVHFAVSDAIWI